MFRQISGNAPSLLFVVRANFEKFILSAAPTLRKLLASKTLSSRLSKTRRIGPGRNRRASAFIR
jgi:hypothetical protein